MKIRQGHVSNSSSSSFIIGLGIVPANKLEEFKTRFPNNLVNLSELVSKEKQDWWGVRYDPKRDLVKVSSFNDYEITISDITGILNKDIFAHALMIDDSGAEPEYDEDSWEYNYDDVEMDEEWFDKEQLDVVNAIFSECDKGQAVCGGGFNG